MAKGEKPPAPEPPPVRRVAVVFNPVTGKDRARRRRDEMKAVLGRTGLDVAWYETTPEEPGEGQVRSALTRGVDEVMAAGGDGTVMACASALAGTDTPLALLPAGTGNLTALNFDIPLDLEAAVDVALNGERRRIDVGSVGDHRFVAMAGIGFDALLLRDAPERLKQLVGPLAYVLSGLKHLWMRPAVITVRRDDGETIRRPGHCVLVGNLGRLQGGLLALPHADACDGRLDVAVVSAGGLRRWAKVAWRVWRRHTDDDAQVETFRAVRVEVEVDRAMPYELDGDVFPPTRSFIAEALPASLTLCVPRYRPRGADSTPATAI
jgi:YegS/Rv2252/BmrU family lipid kinase